MSIPYSYHPSPFVEDGSIPAWLKLEPFPTDTMASEYTPYNMTHADFNSQPSPTYRPGWSGPNFESSKGSCDAHPTTFPSLAHGGESSTSPTNPHYYTQDPPYDHAPHHMNQTIVYPESSQRTLMDDTVTHRPTYDIASTHIEAQARVALFSGSSDPARTTGIKFHGTTSSLVTSASLLDRPSYTYPAMHPLTTSFTSHEYRAAAPSPQHSPQDPSSLHRPFATGLALSFLSSPSSTSPSSPISLFNHKLDRRPPAVLTLEMQSLTVGDPENHSSLSSVVESMGDTSGPEHKHEQLFSSTVASMIGTPTSASGSPYAHDMFAKEVSDPARSNSSLSGSSGSAPESDRPASPYSSFPNGVGVRGRTSVPTSGATRTSRKNKMHRCKVCGKSFPRPSGLNTHMNSHNGKKRKFECYLLICFY